MPIERKAFFDAVRASFGALNQRQVDGFAAILDQWAARGGGDDRHLAYMLATAWHETNRTMQPVCENLIYTSAGRIQAEWPRLFPTSGSAVPFLKNPRGLANRVYGGRLGNTAPDDGWTFRGRGYVQLTGRENYARAAKELGVDLVGKPDLAIMPDVAADIMFAGMEAGWFTGKKLSDFEGGGREFDARNARRIINGLDCADQIAGYYRTLLRALLVAQSKPIAIPPPPDIEPVSDASQPATSGGLFCNAVKKILRRPA